MRSVIGEKYDRPHSGKLGRATLLPSATCATLATMVVLMVGSSTAVFGQTDNDGAGNNSRIVDSMVRTADFHKQPVANPESAAHGISLGTSHLQGVNVGVKQRPNLLDGIKARAQGIQFGNVIGSLAIVLGGYFGFVWLTRKISPGSNSGLPNEVVEILGQTSFGPRKSLQLVRLGSKLLLLVNSPDGTHSVGEITDPHEVEYLASVCSGQSSGRGPIAIRKASSAGPHPGSRSDLKRVLQQLQGSGDGNRPSIFEA
jgi:flagellar biogenesis protein FliO